MTHDAIMTLDVNDDEMRVLAQSLRPSILSPRLTLMRAILAKLDPIEAHSRVSKADGRECILGSEHVPPTRVKR
jgi:hypothetical protein